MIDNVPSCVPCEPGTYNGLVGQGQCTPCPEHMSTLENGLLTNELCRGTQNKKMQYFLSLMCYFVVIKKIGIMHGNFFLQLNALHILIQALD